MAKQEAALVLRVPPGFEEGIGESHLGSSALLNDSSNALFYLFLSIKLVPQACRHPWAGDGQPGRAVVPVFGRWRWGHSRGSRSRAPSHGEQQPQPQMEKVELIYLQERIKTNSSPLFFFFSFPVHPTRGTRSVAARRGGLGNGRFPSRARGR